MFSTSIAMDTVVTFGKCRGMTLKEIALENPKYLRYLNSYEIHYDEDSDEMCFEDAHTEYNQWIWDNKPELIQASRIMCMDKNLCMCCLNGNSDHQDVQMHNSCRHYAKTIAVTKVS